MTEQSIVHRLRELIQALERRAPRPERASETGIAREAEALRQQALAQITKLET